MKKSIGVLALVLLMDATTAQQTVPLPPLQLAGAGKRSAQVPTTYDGLFAAVAYDLFGRKLEITWYRDFGLAYPKKSFQHEALGYWPTEVCEAGANKLLVAGKTSKGQTVIRLWEFSATETLDPAYDDPNTGQTVYPDSYLPITQKELLYQG